MGPRDLQVSRDHQDFLDPREMLDIRVWMVYQDHQGWMVPKVIVASKESLATQAGPQRGPGVPRVTLACLALMASPGRRETLALLAWMGCPDRRENQEQPTCTDPRVTKDRKD